MRTTGIGLLGLLLALASTAPASAAKRTVLLELFTNTG